MKVKIINKWLFLAIIGMLLLIAGMLIELFINSKDIAILCGGITGIVGCCCVALGTTLYVATD